MNNFKKRGHCGCNQGGCSGFHQGQSTTPNCKKLGPFSAVDAACLPGPGVPIGPAITGSIIPFSSGTIDAVLTSIAGGLVGTTSLVGFGTSIPGINILGNTIDLSILATEAFSVPRPGNITAISASFTALAALALIGSTVTVNAQIYRAPEGSNIYTATDATVSLTPYTGALSIGDLATGSASDFAPVPVAVGDRLLMVFSITSTGLTVLNVVTGSATAGITIA